MRVVVVYMCLYISVICVWSRVCVLCRCDVCGVYLCAIVNYFVCDMFVCVVYAMFVYLYMCVGP